MPPNLEVEYDASMEPLVQDCIQYIIFCTIGDSKSIVRQSDLNRVVLKEANRRSFRPVIREVRRQLKKTFGLLLVDLAEVEGSPPYEKFGIATK